ncbi:16S rRNA (guanine(527)-N(7))-methyltransferase RsmG [Cohnella sp. CFH 77786]|uniref:16S rRNA (guanine(527)-N(7))-methyltransferase RsmG n=1 Tax=Cohnella sp. CFH 77786 TaxID=2662265 RepID=UPI001C60B27C|nr:16S rRNA (guanine(527)-N(7))-methyltransferase RsmG [Cohnella sp. CFH 77786]MBW5448799.1 16S rRNA (guanine(527)-N(7))-methyltransferase RsmG [Cohnella sp. CFH 77786]
MDQIQRDFVDRLADLGIVLSEPAQQLEQFEAYYRLLVEWNEKMNLTGITERSAVYEKHFYDSLTLASVTDLRDTASMADIGSGAGFPSLPVKIAFPHLKITIVDALAKRIRFLEEVVSSVGLANVVCLHGRAEEVSRKSEHRDRYDLVTARAVARLAALNELCLPFVRTGGTFVAMKGSDITEELEESLYSVKQLNGTIRDTVQLQLPEEGSARHLIVIAKTGSTPKAYPRKPGLPLKQPLVIGSGKTGSS